MFLLGLPVRMPSNTACRGLIDGGAQNGKIIKYKTATNYPSYPVYTITTDIHTPRAKLLAPII